MAASQRLDAATTLVKRAQDARSDFVFYTTTEERRERYMERVALIQADALARIAYELTLLNDMRMEEREE